MIVLPANAQIHPPMLNGLPAILDLILAHDRAEYGETYMI
jgi:hypothetical protein